MADDKLKVLRGSIFLKLLVLVGVGLIVSVFLIGMPTSLDDLVWSGVKIFLGIILLVLIFKGIQSVFKPKPFSPTESFKKKVIRVAKLSKPFNVKRLFLRGEDMRVYSKWGKITGLCFIPYVTAKNKLDKDGNIIFVPKLDLRGKQVLNSDGKVVKIPEKELLTEKDGEWLFVIQTHPIPLLGKEELVRAHYKLCSEMGESVWIKSPNLVPIGDFFYPTQQWQDDLQRVLTQHKAEAIVELHEEFLDLLAHVTQMSLGSDPNFQKIMLAQSEAIAARGSGVMVRNE